MHPISTFPSSFWLTRESQTCLKLLICMVGETVYHRLLVIIRKILNILINQKIIILNWCIITFLRFSAALITVLSAWSDNTTAITIIFKQYPNCFYLRNSSTTSLPHLRTPSGISAEQNSLWEGHCVKYTILLSALQSHQEWLEIKKHSLQTLNITIFFK